MKNYLKTVWELFLTFFIIGLTTFGGGYAMIPIVKNAVVDKKKWIDDTEMIKILAVSESTPGPIAINMATFIGYKRAGVLGSLLATLGVILPSFTVILIIALFLNNLMEYKIVVSIFNGIRCAVAVLITVTAINMFKKMQKTPFTVTVLIITLILLTLINIFGWNFSSIYLVALGLVAGVVFTSVTDYKKNKNSVKKEQNVITSIKKDKKGGKE